MPTRDQLMRSDARCAAQDDFLEHFCKRPANGSPAPVMEPGVWTTPEEERRRAGAAATARHRGRLGSGDAFELSRSSAADQLVSDDAADDAADARCAAAHCCGSNSASRSAGHIGMRSRTSRR